MMKRKYKKKKQFVVHHISYKPERTVNIYHGEHMILTRLQWRNKVSKGFIQALKEWIDEHRKMATELGKDNFESIKKGNHIHCEKVKE